MNPFKLWLVVVVFALSGCATFASIIESRESKPASESASDAEHAGESASEAQHEQLEPLPQVAAAKALTAELLWRRNQGWMTRSSFLSGAHPFSDGSVLVAGQNTGELTLGQGDAATTIVGRSGQNGRRPWIARYDQDGELIWATPIAGNAISSLAIASDDSIIVTGRIAAHDAAGNDFEISRVFGAGTPRETRVPGCEPAFEVFRREAPQRDWAPTSYSAGVGGAPTCSIRFVARFDRDGNFQWVRSAHSQYRSSSPIPVVLPDGSVVVRFTFAGVALLEAGTPSQRDLLLPLERLEQNVPFLVRYRPDGAIASVSQLSAPGERLSVQPFPREDGLLGLVGWRGMASGTTARDRYKESPPIFTLSGLDDHHHPLWDIEIEIPPETFYGASTPDNVDRFPNGDLLITFGHRFRDATGLYKRGEVLHETASNPITEQYEAARIQYALRVDQRGHIRWLIPTVQAQRDRGGAPLPDVLVMDDGSWLLYGGPKEGDTDYVIAPGQPHQRSMGDDDGRFIARFFPDGRLDTLVDSPELSHWYPSSRIRLPDGTFISVREDWEVTPDVPTPVITRIRLELTYDDE